MPASYEPQVQFASYFPMNSTINAQLYYSTYVVHAYSKSITEQNEDLCSGVSLGHEQASVFPRNSHPGASRRGEPGPKH